jgi:hypothetical protein
MNDIDLCQSVRQGSPFLKCEDYTQTRPRASISDIELPLDFRKHQEYVSQVSPLRRAVSNRSQVHTPRGGIFVGH